MSVLISRSIPLSSATISLPISSSPQIPFAYRHPHGIDWRHHRRIRYLKFGRPALSSPDTDSGRRFWKQELNQIAHRADRIPHAARDLRHQRDGGSERRAEEQSEAAAEDDQGVGSKTVTLRKL